MPIDSLPSLSAITRGRFTIAPVPSIAAWGGTRIGVSDSAPRLPVVVICNVPPRAARSWVGWGLVVGAALGMVGDRAGEPGERQVAGVVDHWGQQTLVGVHRDAQVLGAVIRDLLGFLVVDRKSTRLN